MMIGADPKDLAIADMKRTLAKIERALRAAGSVEFKCYHNERDRHLDDLYDQELAEELNELDEEE